VHHASDFAPELQKEDGLKTAMQFSQMSLANSLRTPPTCRKPDVRVKEAEHVRELTRDYDFGKDK
jgi:hypothetical protein